MTAAIRSSPLRSMDSATDRRRLILAVSYDAIRASMTNDAGTVTQRAVFKPIPATAIQIVRNATARGGVAFGSVIRGLTLIYPYQRIETRWHDDSIRESAWTRFELKAHRSRDFGTKNWLTVSESPVTSTRCDVARFRGYWRKGDAARPDPLLERFEDDRAVRDWIEHQLRCDWWEKSGEILTAGISDPAAPMVEEVDIRDFGKSGYITLGISDEPPEDLFNTLWSDPDHVHSLPLRARKDKLKFWHPGASGYSPTLFEDIDEAVILDCLKASVWQALSGPAPREKKSEAAWSGEPVVELVEEIFCKHLNNLNRRTSHDHENERPADARRREERQRPSDADQSESGADGSMR